MISALFPYRSYFAFEMKIMADNNGLLLLWNAAVELEGSGKLFCRYL